MRPLGILGLVIMAVGFALVLTASTLVKKFDLAKKQKCEHEQEMSQEEVENYKLTKATFNIKLLGLGVTVPGIILLLVFK